MNKLESIIFQLQVIIRKLLTFFCMWIKKLSLDSCKEKFPSSSLLLPFLKASSVHEQNTIIFFVVSQAELTPYFIWDPFHWQSTILHLQLPVGMYILKYLLAKPGAQSTDPHIWFIIFLKPTYTDKD